MNLRKRTPCVGICSTTYGDLVCRGCKRFAHEIVQWNGYDVEQQERVWQRLHDLRDTVVQHFLSVADPAAFEQACASASIEASRREAAIYALLSRLVAQQAPLASAGLERLDAADAAVSDEQSALAVMQAVDLEVYARSVAHYEHSFKIPV